MSDSGKALVCLVGMLACIALPMLSAGLLVVSMPGAFFFGVGLGTFGSRAIR